MAAGLFLIIRGILFVPQFDLHSCLKIAAAIPIGYLKSRLTFYKIIDNNMTRIKELAPEKEKICIFAFQAFQSYLLVLIMISLGMILRLSSIDRLILGIIYVAIGFALLNASLKYFKASSQFRHSAGR